MVCRLDAWIPLGPVMAGVGPSAFATGTDRSWRTEPVLSWFKSSLATQGSTGIGFAARSSDIAGTVPPCSIARRVRAGADDTSGLSRGSRSTAPINAATAPGKPRRTAIAWGSYLNAMCRGALGTDQKSGNDADYRSRGLTPGSIP